MSTKRANNPFSRLKKELGIIDIIHCSKDENILNETLPYFTPDQMGLNQRQGVEQEDLQNLVWRNAMEAREIIQDGIYLNHDAVSERTVTSIHDNGGRDKEVYFLDHSKWTHGVTTLGQMAAWATERVDIKRKRRS